MQLFSACETTNPDRGAIMNKKSLRPGVALFGFSHLISRPAHSAVK
jgi:hypothetical protein